MSLLFVFSQAFDLLKVEGKIEPQILSRGQEGKLILNLETPEGININLIPSMVIEFKSSQELIFPKGFFTAADLEIEFIEKEGNKYLNLEKEIEIPFTVSLEAKKGKHKLRGEIKYFACSVKEGWCLKSSTKFSIPFSTRKSIYRKKS